VWDNALAESFFSACKLALIEPPTWPTRARAQTATVQWLEAIYNRRRRHSAMRPASVPLRRRRPS